VDPFHLPNTYFSPLVSTERGGGFKAALAMIKKSSLAVTSVFVRML